MAICYQNKDASIKAGWKRRRYTPTSSKDVEDGRTSRSSESRTSSWFRDSSSSMELTFSNKENENSILRRTSSATSESQQARSAKHVSFGVIQVYSHRYTLGDNPSVMGGPPITLEWKAFETYSFSVDDYESVKPEPRSKASMVLPRSMRQGMLRNQGFSRGELKEATDQAERIRLQRAKSSRDGVLARHFEKLVNRLKRGKDASHHGLPPTEVSAE